ncbi:probable (S)-N-methylcoclaurine 3'-hydroxylase isozyme 2 [Lycium barbarum]|uniref:probable (S)-N-methylcoclaurine 3'-hydroxylase isozyme 2 n=1 Tax=Lycium barbarum TaxID=112863 RepID=UPI00293ECD36|nr:probable (S)-N-methylcoclaurine 3'-hydroxylase isozyme 2 [Lycium barbarum]
MEMIQHLATKQGQVIKIRDVIFVTVLNILGNLLRSMDLIDFVGKGVGEEMRKNLRRFTETGATQELADMYPVLGVICTLSFQGTYKKIMDLFDKTSVVWAGIVQDRRKNSQLSLNAVDFVDALVKNGFTDKHINGLLMNYLELEQKQQLLQVNGCLWSS